jgi:RIO kinase 1
MTTRARRRDDADTFDAPRSDFLPEDEWSEDTDEPDPLDPFLADGTITEVFGALKSGKEGTVYLCRANPSLGEDLLAAKVYRSRNERTFRNDAVYAEGRSYGKARENRAVKNKSRRGREFQYGEWLRHEFAALTALWNAGAAVPRPVAQAEAAILMQYIGDADAPASGLQSARLGLDEIRPLFDRIMGNVELFLRCNYVHGDLSPYNVLYWKGKMTIIDFPQSVDPRANSNAFDLLARDVDHVCQYFVRHGMNLNPTRITQHLWGRFLRMDL